MGGWVGGLKGGSEEVLRTGSGAIALGLLTGRCGGDCVSKYAFYFELLAISLSD